MTVFHFKADMIEQEVKQATYKVYLDFDGRKGWCAIATARKQDGQFSIESREYELTERMRNIENHCLKALQHKLKKHIENEGDFPPEIIFIA